MATPILVALLVAPAVPPPQQQAVLVAGQDVPAPIKLRSSPPEYPDVARQARMQGLVVLAVTVDEEGRPAELKVLGGIPILDEAAIRAVKEWRYAPTALDGVRRRVKFIEHVLFYLSDQDHLRAASEMTLDGHGPTPRRVWAISELLRIPRKYRGQVSESLSKAATDPDPTVAAAAKLALEQLPN